MFMLKKAAIELFMVFRGVLFWVFVLVVIWYLWWLVFSPRVEFWSLLDQINPLYSSPSEIIKALFESNGFEGHRFAALVGFLSLTLRGVLQAVVAEMKKEETAGKSKKK
jgi:hypothetical protein